MKVINMKYQDRVTVGDDVIIICPKQKTKIVIDAPETKKITYYSASEWAKKNRAQNSWGASRDAGLQSQVRDD